APAVALSVDLSSPVYFDLAPLGEGVDHRHADAVKAAGHLVAAAFAKLASGVKGRHHRLHGRPPRFGMDADRDTPTVVAHTDAAVFEDRHGNGIPVAILEFIDAVVDDFEDKMMQTPFIGAADVHAWTASYGVEAFEHLDMLGLIDTLHAILCHWKPPSWPTKTVIRRSRLVSSENLGVIGSYRPNIPILRLLSRECQTNVRENRFRCAV